MNIDRRRKTGPGGKAYFEDYPATPFNELYDMNSVIMGQTLYDAIVSLSNDQEFVKAFTNSFGIAMGGILAEIPIAELLSKEVYLNSFPVRQFVAQCYHWQSHISDKFAFARNISVFVSDMHTAATMRAGYLVVYADKDYNLIEDKTEFIDGACYIDSERFTDFTNEQQYRADLATYKAHTIKTYYTLYKFAIDNSVIPIKVTEVIPGIR